eukprot:CAMPEP_0194413866 /NCGR_PEP_ID=MMETSP0176-20130528/12405_1 /TAXON_ID=216777 /ORGANISM="Proboscia alata, Strain PI-D3" /LENGTH=125 /DNA_ID=CAMNT_0039217441 /DNA_START=349 /DNA_END=726 /DNA_ORIENTATION=+
MAPNSARIALPSLFNNPGIHSAPSSTTVYLAFREVSSSLASVQKGERVYEYTTTGFSAMVVAIWARTAVASYDPACRPDSTAKNGLRSPIPVDAIVKSGESSFALAALAPATTKKGIDRNCFRET